MAVILLGLVLGFTGASAWALRRLRCPADGHDLAARVDAEVRKVLKPGGPRSLVVGLLKDGQVRISTWVNPAAGDSSSPPPLDALVQIGSVTKLFTAALAQVLCDEGQLNLDASLSDLLGPAVPLAPRAGRITVRQLATHTAGLPRLPPSFVHRLAGLPQDEQLHDPYRGFTRQEVLDYLQDPQGMRPPGRFLYSNLGMGLLGHVLEIVCGQTYEALVAERLLRPLGMTDTAVTLTPALQARHLQGHTAQGRPTPPWAFGALAGAGAFSSDAADLLRFLQAQQAFTSREGAACTLSASLRAMHGDSAHRPLGWMTGAPLDRLLGQGTVLWHDGMVGGYSSYVGLMPDRGLGVVVLSNSAVPVTMTGLMLMRLLRTQSWAGEDMLNAA